jgi:arylsulfatase A-like enzyme
MSGFIRTCCLIGALSLACSDAIAGKRPPNIVIIFMDDLGYGDLGCYGAVDFRTPNIDRLAAEGMRFTNFLSAQPVCSASRAALLSGCYPNRIGISGALYPGAPYGIAKEETLLPEMLKAKGYATGIFGKWHLGDTSGYLPPSHGFDEYMGLPYSNDMWPVEYDGTRSKTGSRFLWYPPLPLLRGDKVVDTVFTLEQQAALTGMLTDEAIRFIRKNAKKPFLAYVPYPMPHVPINATKGFRGGSRQGLFGDMIQEVDHHVGRIMQCLRDEGLDGNTLVIFTSDNGPWANFGNHAGSTGGLREGKGTTFEGGVRVPCIMRWKGVVPAGMVANQLACAIDILPTVAALTGSPLPERLIDGVDFSGVLKGNPDLHPRKTFLYYYRTNSLEAVRIDNWKLVFAHPSRSYEGQAPGRDGVPGMAPETVSMPQALYDLRRDPGERYDVQGQHPEMVKRLEALAEEARRDLGDELTGSKGANRRPADRIRR